MIRIIKKFKIYFVIGILVIVNLLLFSGVSPLQSIYNMQYDEWLFYLIGKGMTEGRVPYIDLMDHKGPYLFYFFALVNLIPYKHIGFFIFSSIIYIFIAVFSYKISLLILGERKYRTPVALFTSFAIYFMASSYYISFGTITSEIITLPFTLISYYLFLKYLYDEKVTHKLSYMAVYGICAGIVFFIKANAILAYVPIAIYLLIYLIKKKQYKNLLSNAICGLVSFIIALTPAIIYSLATNSFYEMIKGAFIINIRYVGFGLPGVETVFDSLVDTITKFKEFTILCIFSIFAYMSFMEEKHTKNVIVFYILSLIINIYSVYMSCRPYTNYLAYLLFYFIPLISFFAYNIVRILNIKKVYLILSIVIVLINVLSYGLTLDLSNLSGSHKMNVAKRVTRVCIKNGFTKPKPNLLVVGYEPYLYEAFGTIPNEKFFATPVVKRSDYSEPYDALVRKIRSGREDIVVVTFNNAMLDDAEFQNEVYAALEPAYKNIGTVKYLNTKCEVYIKDAKN